MSNDPADRESLHIRRLSHCGTRSVSSTHIVRVILLVSCAHAFVHLLEQSIASVEQVISRDFALSLQESGWLGAALRLPYGFGAFASGLFADRVGEKRVLVLYLLGSAILCASFLGSDGAAIVYAQLFGVGAFASMYHPAGLSLLANETTPSQRARALGTHGVFGSCGIAFAPFLAGLVLSVRPGDWKGYYLGLGLVGGVLGVLVWWLLKPTERISSVAGTNRTPQAATSLNEVSPLFQRLPFVLLIAGTALSGIIYGGVLHFLPRFLKDGGVFDELNTWSGWEISEEALANYSAAFALICGAFGQWFAGRIARPGRLPFQLSLVYAANIPFLVWMSFSDGIGRLVAACLWAFVHFMNQPIYNSLLPEYLPRHRRSAGFGFSNMMGFGIGAVGPLLVADFDKRFADYTWSYSALAVLAFVACLLPLPLSKIQPRRSVVESTVETRSSDG